MSSSHEILVPREQVGQKLFPWKVDEATGRILLLVDISQFPPRDSKDLGFRQQGLVMAMFALKPGGRREFVYQDLEGALEDIYGDLVFLSEDVVEQRRVLGASYHWASRAIDGFVRKLSAGPEGWGPNFRELIGWIRGQAEFADLSDEEIAQLLLKRKTTGDALEDTGPKVAGDGLKVVQQGPSTEAANFKTVDQRRVKEWLDRNRSPFYTLGDVLLVLGYVRTFSEWIDQARKRAVQLKIVEPGEARVRLSEGDFTELCLDLLNDPQARQNFRKPREKPRGQRSGESASTRLVDAHDAEVRPDSGTYFDQNTLFAIGLCVTDRSKDMIFEKYGINTPWIRAQLRRELVDPMVRIRQKMASPPDFDTQIVPAAREALLRFAGLDREEREVVLRLHKQEAQLVIALLVPLPRQQLEALTEELFPVKV